MERKIRSLPTRLLRAGALCGLLGLSTGSARAPGTEITKPSILASPVVMAAADPKVRIATLEAALRTASRELHWANLTIQKKDAEIELLQERLRKQRIGFLGPSSETLSDLQLELLAEEEPGATLEAVAGAGSNCTQCRRDLAPNHRQLEYMGE